MGKGKNVVSRKASSVRNTHGVKVMKCCASCHCKMVDELGRRICAAMMLKVNGKFRCSQWRMDLTLDNAGRNNGRVKKREYLMYVLDIRCHEDFEIEQGLITKEERRTVEQIRLDYETANGSIWDIE